MALVKNMQNQNMKKSDIPKEKRKLSLAEIRALMEIADEEGDTEVFGVLTDSERRRFNEETGNTP